MSRVEQFEGIRRDRRDGELSIRELAKKHHVHRRSVRAALLDAVPAARKVPDLKAPRKQRHTARRVWQRLIEEEGAVVAESSVRNLVAGLKAQIGASRTPGDDPADPPARG